MQPLGHPPTRWGRIGNPQKPKGLANLSVVLKCWLPGDLETSARQSVPPEAGPPQGLPGEIYGKLLIFNDYKSGTRVAMMRSH
jgi:hypothetical protein